MRRVVWTALIGLLLQPVAAVVCEVRCLAAAGGSAVVSTATAEPGCHQPSEADTGTRVVSAPRADRCVHAEPPSPTPSPLPRTSVAILATLGAPMTSVAVTTATSEFRTPHPLRHRAPDKSSGTLRV